MDKYKLWQDGNQVKIVFRKEFLVEKPEYISKKPVQVSIVEKTENYLFSSVRNYPGLDLLLEIVEESAKLITY